MSRIELRADDVRRLSWFGAKPALARLLSQPLINRVMHIAGQVMLPERIARRLPLNKASVVYRLDDGGSIVLLDPLHDIVARDIYWGGGKAVDSAERHKLAALERLSRSAATFVDVGAYAGICSLIAARANPNLRAIAYEIVPENYVLLVRNIIANDLIEQIVPRLCGIGQSPGNMRLPKTFGAASFMTSISLGSKFSEGVSVGIATLDDQLAGAPGPILIKIDVEGFEDQVFLGAENIIRERRPDIICEILPGADESCALISQMLAPLGYRWFCFEPSGMEARKALAPSPAMRDWLFTTKVEGSV